MNGSEPVAVKTMLQILAQTGTSGPIDLLKCDIEGAEQELFADCAAWISRVRNLVIEVHPPYTPDALRAELERNGASFDLSPVGNNVYLLRQCGGSHPIVDEAGTRPG